MLLLFARETAEAFSLMKADTAFRGGARKGLYNVQLERALRVWTLVKLEYQ